MKNKQSRGDKDEEFPLEAYTTVYKWIGTWAKKTSDPELRVIAQAAFESLTAVGIIVTEVTKTMADEIESLRASKTIH
jgi:hypothetical protein